MPDAQLPLFYPTEEELFMSFKIVVTEVIETAAVDADGNAIVRSIERYSQTVDALDLPTFVSAINRKPRKQQKVAKK